MDLFPWFLYAHILGAIVAFGPSFSAPIIGAMGGAEPAHRAFALRVSDAIAKQRILPLAVVQGITGVGLVLTGHIDLFASHWLLLGIVLYVIALGIGFGVMTPTVAFLIERSKGAPPAAHGAPPAAHGATVAAPVGMAAMGGGPGGAIGVAAAPPVGMGSSAATATMDPPTTTNGTSHAPTAPMGPPPEIAAAVRRVQVAGMSLTVLIVAIVFLMVVRPAF